MPVAVVLVETGVLEVIEGPALQRPGRKGEAGRVDDVKVDAKARAEAKQGAGVLRDVRLIQRQIDCHVC